MSVAFTREDSAETAAEVDLPDRLVSPHPNLVTRQGLEQLSKTLAEARSVYEASQRIEDANERRRAAAPALRDIRYYAERVASAQLVPEPGSADTVAFGSQVTFVRDDGRRQTFRIVGEDEAEPRNGTISYISPVARALMGKVLGDFTSVADQELEIVEIA